jgi:hypothetical protein
MKAISLLVAALGLVFVASIPASTDAEAGWKPSNNRFKGCKQGFYLDAKGRCVK